MASLFGFPLFDVLKLLGAAICVVVLFLSYRLLSKSPEPTETKPIYALMALGLISAGVILAATFSPPPKMDLWSAIYTIELETGRIPGGNLGLKQQFWQVADDLRARSTSVPRQRPRLQD